MNTIYVKAIHFKDGLYVDEACGKIDLSEMVFHGFDEPVHIDCVKTEQKDEKIVITKGNDTWMFTIIPSSDILKWFNIYEDEKDEKDDTDFEDVINYDSLSDDNDDY